MSGSGHLQRCTTSLALRHAVSLPHGVQGAPENAPVDPPILKSRPLIATSGIRDNHARGTVADFLRAHLRPDAALDLVTAYFTVFAYERLRHHLDALGPIRLLFGEPAFIQTLDPEHTEGASFVLESEGLTLAAGLGQRNAALACARWIEDKVRVRSVTRAGFLHGKMALIRRGESSAAIVGSSNFTTRGLGLGATNNNVELNLVVSDDRDRADIQAWFEELWDDTSRVEDVKAAVLDYLRQVYRDQPPEFIYLKTLYELFRNQLESDRNTDDTLRRIRLPETKIWKSLFAFQRDGAKSAINKLKEYGGCILADSVGLGKTYEALAVIKYFELRNEKVLVLCPSKLRENWDVYPAYAGNRQNPFAEDRFGYTVLAHTDLSRTTGASGAVTDLANFNWGAFDLVVIDESHNFRNNSIGRLLEDGTERRTRYQRLLEDIIQAGVPTKVLLLSATPVNNELSDLRNQISFIAGADVARDKDGTADTTFNETLGIASISATTRAAQARFTEWAKRPATERQKGDLIHVLGGDFLKLLDALTIARSRKHVTTHYAEEMDRLGGFSVRLPPVSITPEIDTARVFPSYDTVAKQLDSYHLWVFRPAKHLRKDLPADITAHYLRKIGGFNQEGRERILTGMMRVTLLKRLESSIDSFRISLRNTLRRIEDLERRMDRFEAHQMENPDLDMAELDPAELEEDDPELSAALQVGKRVTFKMAHLDLNAWRAHLQEDRQKIGELLAQAEPVSPHRDAKLAELKRILAEKAAHPSTHKDGKLCRKVLVFTAFADTARYLYENVHTWASAKLHLHSALVVGSGDNRSTLGSSTNFGALLADFAPRAKKRAQYLGTADGQPEVDILIASDCISEGQNLQDCDTVINYDIHWNPVRIIQRFGRIDRIGSLAHEVHLVNFWPTPNLDRYINLKQRVEARMALVDVTATQTDNPLDEKQLEDLVTSDLQLRNRQLERMRTEVLDLEDLDDSVTLADFSLDDFRADLARFLKENEEQLRNAPLGLCAIVPPDPTIPLGTPGVIFCLRRRGEASDAARRESEKLNPLSPHYLVYVRASGEVRLAYTQVKSVLNLFRELALGKTEPYAELCRQFDDTTRNGTQMQAYTRLVTAAVESITATFQRKLAAGLQSSRQFVLPLAEEQPTTDETEFELVTWLVLQDGASPTA